MNSLKTSDKNKTMAKKKKITSFVVLLAPHLFLSPYQITPTKSLSEQHQPLWCDFIFTTGNVILQKSEVCEIVLHLMNNTETTISMEIGMGTILTSL